MAKAVKCEIAHLGPYRIVGKEIRTTILSPQISALWARCFADGTYESLGQMKEYIPEDIAEDYIGYIRDIGNDGMLTYVVGMFMKPDAPVPEGFVSYDIPECAIGKIQIQGEEYDIYPNAHALSVDAIEQMGYQVDEENLFACQVYTDERFGIPKNRGERVLIMDYYLPCQKQPGR